MTQKLNASGVESGIETSAGRTGLARRSVRPNLARAGAGSLFCRCWESHVGLSLFWLEECVLGDVFAVLIWGSLVPCHQKLFRRAERFKAMEAWKRRLAATTLGSGL